MHGLVNKALERFVTHTYGEDRWRTVSNASGLDGNGFEAMLLYEDSVTEKVLDALRRELCRDLDDILEDIGTYLVSHQQEQRLRRLLRFSGVTYVDFLLSLDDLADRVRLAVSDLDLPALDLHEQGGGAFTLFVGGGIPGYAQVVMGILRAMADDYGALALLEYQGRSQRADVISIRLIDNAFAEGRAFALGGREA